MIWSRKMNTKIIKHNYINKYIIYKNHNNIYLVLVYFKGYLNECSKTNYQGNKIRHKVSRYTLIK